VTPEAKVKAKIKEILQEEKIYYAMPIGTGYGNSGVPDFLCCVHGYFLGIEAKANGNKPTALQTKNLKQIVDSGGCAIVVNDEIKSLFYLKDLIRELKELSNG
jgi:hypothetical protein